MLYVICLFTFRMNTVVIFKTALIFTTAVNTYIIMHPCIIMSLTQSSIISL